MSIKDIAEKYDYFRARLFASATRNTLLVEDDPQEAFKKEMERVFSDLTPEERQDLFRSLLDKAKRDLEDHITECYVLDTLECMAVVQIFSQLVGE